MAGASYHLGKVYGMTEAKLHDGSTVELEIHGEGPTLLLPENPHPVVGPQADEMKKYGADPALGQALIQGLSNIYRVVAFDYQGNVLNIPKPDTLTPENVANDLLAVADAVNADQFVYYGYSWLAMVGLQLALRTTRLSGLIMGGFPPLNGPYREMLRVTTASYERAAGILIPQEEDEWSSSSLTVGQTQQFMTLYQALQDFDDHAAQSQITCPRLCFAGTADAIQYGKDWGDVLVNIGGPLVNGQAELEALGWDVRVLDGLDHMQAMQAAQVVPIIRSLRNRC